MPKTQLTKKGRPKPENFENAIIRLYEAGVIPGSTFYNITRADNITNGEAIRVLTDLAIMTKENYEKALERKNKTPAWKKWLEDK
jgi:hypothetical protein